VDVIKAVVARAATCPRREQQMSAPQELKGPDLAAGIDAKELKPGEPLLGHARGEAIVLVRTADAFCAVGAACTHYGGPLAEGIVEEGTIRCPWHHARYDLRTGEATRPGRDAIACYRVEQQGGRVRVGERLTVRRSPAARGPQSVVIVGAGAAGNACAEELRRRGYGGPITMIGAEGTLPVDRPNLSKDYLAGTAPEDWVPLRSRDFYSEHRIDVVQQGDVAAIDVASRQVRLGSGDSLRYGALLLATGAEAVRLGIPGAERALTLRSFADSKAIIARVSAGQRAVVVGASFIGLEVAASLRARNADVAVVAPEARPLERVLGPQLGDFLRALHEEHGVRFHLGRKPVRIDGGSVALDDGSTLPADVVVMGVGVRPRLKLAEDAGLRMDRGVAVDATMRTSAEAVWAAGDIARFPFGGRGIRVEHWVVAERQGQHAARAMLGSDEPYRAVPFFWSQHYDVPINYVGHAETWDSIEVVGDVAGRNCLVAYRQAGRVLAVASIYRDRESLLIEAAMERGDDAAVAAHLRS
jgi:NADPH-dependent 2,4-dienoyl-CoA reductase/sulfur reductase-like enzyme/nitrite reductase/ring-hydroxylating ferredoxin subunit